MVALFFVRHGGVGSCFNSIFANFVIVVGSSALNFAIIGLDNRAKACLIRVKRRNHSLYLALFNANGAK